MLEPKYKIALVGEAWGAEEAEARLPFIGASGRILNHMLRQSGIVREECFVTNVFNLQPQPKNDIINLCGPKAGGIPGMPALTKGKYARAEYASEVKRLYAEIASVRPNLVVCLGGTASWALLHSSGIRAIRGAPTWSSICDVKVIPTYHPAAIMRDYTLRPIVLADLSKAKDQAEFPEWRRPEREVWVEPTFDDLLRFEAEFINPSPNLASDIETIGDQITCIGFAPTVDRALVVPIFDPTKPGKNYWPTLSDEMKVWAWIRRMYQKRKRHIFQNGMYDIHFLWRQYGISVSHASDDTMLLHHALQPEMQKGLGFLGSIYTDEAAWKIERKKNETAKKED